MDENIVIPNLIDDEEKWFDLYNLNNPSEYLEEK